MAKSTPTGNRLRWRWLERLLRAAGLVCLGTVLVTVAEGRMYQLFGRWQLQTADPASVVAEHARSAGVWLGDEAGALEDFRIAWAVDRLAEETDDLPWEAWTQWTAERMPALGRQGESRPDPAAQDPDPRPAPGTPLGTISIPEVGLDAVILEGVGEDVLRRGVGHFPQTPMPGAGGNFALAGHRDTFFRALRQVRAGQRVVITAADGREFVYRVAGTEVVEPAAVEVLDDRGRETVTLITCYPFGYVGPAPRRFVVRGIASGRGS